MPGGMSSIRARTAASPPGCAWTPRPAHDRVLIVVGGGPPSALPELVAWRATTSAFRCKPSRYPCSAEALLKRIARGDEPPAINRLADLYNAIAVAHVLPLGGEDVARVRGQVG
jgi:DNA/RNA-binding domain of Phe-tRNA-synthetase-like protein